MNDCPCCSSKMLRQVSNNRIYWYCLSCHQEMPNLYQHRPKQDLISYQEALFAPQDNKIKLASFAK